MLSPATGAVFGMHHGHVSSKWRPAHRETFLLAENGGRQPAPVALPSTFDWRNVDGVNYVTFDVNQHLPKYCGSCWVHGTVSALNDRIKIQRRAKFPDVMLSRQALMNCVPASPMNGSQKALLAAAQAPPPGCDGGDPWMIHEYMQRVPIPDETCQPYEAQNQACNALGMCRNCFPEAVPGAPLAGGCWPITSYISYGVVEYGSVRGESNMMREIFRRGPIVCSIAADIRLLFNFSAAAAANEGVYSDPIKHGPEEVDHDVSVTGWGVTASGVQYWIVRNSWGTYLMRSITLAQSSMISRWRPWTPKGSVPLLHARALWVLSPSVLAGSNPGSPNGLGSPDWVTL